MEGGRDGGWELGREGRWLGERETGDQGGREGADRRPGTDGSARGMKNQKWELGRELEYRKGDRTELKKSVHRDQDMGKKWTRGKECVRKE